MHHGALQVLAIFDKPDPLDGPFFEETIYVTPSRAPRPEQRRIVDAVAAAAAAIGLRHGPIHAECRVNDARASSSSRSRRGPSAACAPGAALQKHGRDAGGEPDLARGAAAAARARRVAGRMAARGRGLRRHDDSDPEARASTAASRASRRPGGARIDDVRITAKTDQLLVPLPEGASYLGFIFARGATRRRRRTSPARRARAPALRHRSRGAAMVQSPNG